MRAINNILVKRTGNSTVNLGDLRWDLISSISIEDINNISERISSGNSTIYFKQFLIIQELLKLVILRSERSFSYIHENVIIRLQINGDMFTLVIGDLEIQFSVGMLYKAAAYYERPDLRIIFEGQNLNYLQPNLVDSTFSALNINISTLSEFISRSFSISDINLVPEVLDVDSHIPQLESEQKRRNEELEEIKRAPKNFLYEVYSDTKKFGAAVFVLILGGGLVYVCFKHGVNFFPTNSQTPENVININTGDTPSSNVSNLNSGVRIRTPNVQGGEIQISPEFIDKLFRGLSKKDN